jgi:hypothetical protein
MSTPLSVVPEESPKSSTSVEEVKVVEVKQAEDVKEEKKDEDLKQAEEVAQKMEEKLDEQLDKLSAEIKSSLKIVLDCPLPSVVLAVMQCVEKIAKDCKGDLKKAIAMKVLSELELPAETKEMLKMMITSGLIFQMIDSLVDAAKHPDSLRKESNDVKDVKEDIDVVKKGCCTVM